MAVWRKFRLIKALCAIRKYMRFVPDIKISGQAHLCSYLWIYAASGFSRQLVNYKAAVGADNLTGDKFCVSGNQPGHGGGDVFRLAKATQRGFFF